MKPLRILFIGDDIDDMLTAIGHLKNHGYLVAFERVETAENLKTSLKEKWDCIISGAHMPGFSGMNALAILRETDQDIPFILVSDIAGEELAVEAMRAGANDYLMQDKLDRLVPAIEREIKTAATRREKKEIEKALLERNSRFSQLAMELNDVVWMASVDGSQIFNVNDKFEEFYGKTVDEFKANPNLWIEMVHPDDRTIAEESHEKLFREGKATAEYRIVKPDGTIVWLNDRKSIFYDKNGRPVHMGGIARDITGRKQSDEIVAEQAKQLQSMIAIITEGFWITDENGRFLEVNEAYCRMSGYSKEELLTLSISDVEARETTAETARHIRKVMETGSDLFESKHRAKGGEIFNVEVSAIYWKEKKQFLVFSKDITERLKAEAHVREQSRLMDQIFKHSLDLIVILDRDFNFVRVSDSYAKATQRDIAELIGRNHFDIYPSDFKEEAEEIRKGKYIYKKDARPFVYADHPEWGVTYWNIGLVPVLDQYQKIDFFILTLKDVTEDKKKEADLIESENKYRSLVNEISDGFFVTDLNGAHIYANKALADMMGYDSPDEMIGKSFMELVPPEELSRISQLFSATIANKESINVIEAPVIRKDGKPAFLEIKPSLVMEHDKVVGARGVIRDITERRQAEKERKLLAHAIASINECVTITDANNIIRFVNDAFVKTYQYSKEELIGKHISIVRPRDISIELSDKIFNNTFDGGWNGEIINQKKDGTLFPVYLSTSVIQDDRNRPVALIGVAIDITERKRAEEKLIQSEERYKRITQGLTDYLYTVIVKDGKAVKTIHSEACFAITGYTWEEFADDPHLWINMVVQEEKEFVAERVCKILEGKQQPPIEHRIICKDGSIRWVSDTIIPKFDSNGVLISYDGVIKDITEHKLTEIILKTRNAILEFSYHSTLDQMLQKSLDEIEIVTKSKISFFHFVEADQKTLWLQAWSTNTLQNICAAPGKGQHYPIDQAGVWVDCVHSGSAVIHNDYASLQHRKGLPDGHAPVIRELVVPVFRNDKIVGILGVGNKESNYDESDIQTITQIANLTWDIAERKWAEEALLESELKFRNLFENSAVGIYRTTPDGKFILANSILASMLGYATFDELLKINIEDIYSDKIERDTFLELFNKQDFVEGLESKIIRKDGTEIYLRETAKVVRDNKGNVLYLEGIAEDITKQKLAEKELIKKDKLLAALAESTSDLITHTDIHVALQKSLSIIGKGAGVSRVYIFENYYDQETAQWYTSQKQEWASAGMEPQIDNPELQNIPFSAIESFIEPLRHHNPFVGKVNDLPDDDVKDILQAQGIRSILVYPIFIKEAFWGFVGFDECEYERVWSEAELSMLVSFKDSVTSSLERHYSGLELIAAKEKAEESDRLKSSFLANMSHEIRTPMNGILGFADLLKESDLSFENKQEYIGIIQNSGQRLLGIINDLIDISRIEARQVNINISELNINEPVEYLHVFFKPEADAKGLHLSYNCTLSGIDALLYTDKEKIYAILTNLIKNAIKYTNKGSITFGYERKGKNLEFCVEDTGIGIAKNKCKAVFERFVQADLTINKPYEGAGLGLAITKAYVEMLGGEIWVESELEKGSRFYFSIPYKSKSEQTVDIEPETMKKGINHQKEDLKILIAEDEKSAWFYLSEVLKKRSREILFATNGIEAVKLCRENTDIDIVLMDIKMPEMDGYEATGKIREFNKDIVIIAQTAFAMPGDREKAIEAGCDDYIAKPIRKNDLIALMERCIQTKKCKTGS